MSYTTKHGKIAFVDRGLHPPRLSGLAHLMSQKKPGETPSLDSRYGRVEGRSSSSLKTPSTQLTGTIIHTIVGATPCALTTHPSSPYSPTGLGGAFIVTYEDVSGSYRSEGLARCRI